VVSHTDTGGQGIDGSANAPKEMPLRCGDNSVYQNTVEPQLGQKCCSTLDAVGERKATSTIPIVCAALADAVHLGLIASEAQPGG
jgi:hypothetical protein